MYRDGYGVCVLPIWNEDDRIEDIEVYVVKLAPTHEHIIGGAICAKLEDNFYVPMENFQPLDDLWQDDTHDLRDRWFASRDEAEAHAEYTRDRWANPAPWVSFVEL